MVHGLVDSDIGTAPLGACSFKALDVLKVGISLLRGLHLRMHLRLHLGLDLRISKKPSEMLCKFLKLMGDVVDFRVNLAHLKLHLSLVDLDLASGVHQFILDLLADLALMRIIGESTSLREAGERCSVGVQSIILAEYLMLRVEC